MRVLVFWGFISFQFLPFFALSQNIGLVPNFFSNTVSVIDIETDTVMTELPTPDGPNSLTWLPDCSKIFIGSLEDESFFIYNFDGDTFAFDREISVGFAIRGMAVTVDQSELWLADHTNGDIKIYDVGAYSLIDSIDVGSGELQFFVVGGAWDIDFTPDGQKAIVTNATDGALHFIDVATHTISITLSNGIIEAQEGDISSDGSRYALASGGSLRIFNIETESFISSIGVGFSSSEVLWDIDDSRIFVAGNLSNSLITVSANINNDSYSIENSSISVPGEFLSSMGVTPDGEKFYTVHSGNADYVNVFDAMDFSLLDQVSVGNNPGGFGMLIKPLAGGESIICQDDNLLLSIFETSVYHARFNIFADGIIDPNENLTLKAGFSIELNNPFEVGDGSELAISIQDCPN